MGRPRIELHQILKGITPDVYFQPTNNIRMNYPCIVYQLDYMSVQHAENLPYRSDPRYMVTVIDRNPDSEIKDKIAELPLCVFNRFYTADDLNHFVYNLYF